MSTRGRTILFLTAAAGLLAVLLIGLHALPTFGDFHGTLGHAVMARELKARHATDYVTSLNFDLRVFDTVGEEAILFAAVTGVVMLMRHMRDEDQSERRTRADEHRFQGASQALRVQALLMVVLIVACGIYLDLHGALTPGGGFQAGVVLSAGPGVVMLSGRYLTLKKVAPEWMIEALESGGAAGLVLIGIGGLVFAGVFVKNFLPLGTPDQLLSAGIMPVVSIAVGLEVTGALLLIFSEFLDQSLLSTTEGQ
ncbi:MAG TPA: MnhB domain-containing protein [Solirubrobacteraceae bacterium]|jgi:multicomponent Na+:H+ antiporter subunit B|nr:MnhB domain-containing protein [Solirubrobacteraceae bacterium]